MTVALGEPVTFGTIIGGALPAWKDVKGSWFKNAIGEITTNTVKGSFRGALAGMVGAVVDGKDITEGVANGIKNGALGGFAQSVAMVATFGATFVPEDNYDAPEGVLSPFFRSGPSIASLLSPGGGVAIGRSLTVNKISRRRAKKLGINQSHYNRYLTAHEAAHYYQQVSSGIVEFYERTTKEYLMYGQKNTYLTFGTLEYEAEQYAFNRLGYYYNYYLRKRYAFP